MTWKVVIRPPALADIESAADWYEQRQAGLGADFVTRVRVAIADLGYQPTLPRLRHRRWGVRWVYPKRFPHRIIYVVATEQVTVIGVLHAARHDITWKERLE